MDDAELKSKWVKALRSGEYPQGTANFERNNRFCCLGVLCKVAGVPTHADNEISGNWNFADHTVGGAHISDSLARMNDNGTSFQYIADYIEQNL